MALKTDSLLSISSNGVEYDKIGLSKTLNNYTFDELFNSVYCSADSNLIYHVASGGDITYYDYQDNPDNGHIPVKLTPVGQNRSAIYFPNDNPMKIPDGLYFRVIWLQRTRSGYDSYINKDGAGQFYKAITMLDSRHYVWECNPPTKQKNNYGANSWDAEDNLYCSESGALYYYDDVKSANPTRILVSNVIPAIIFKFNDHNYILPYRQKMAYFFTKDNTHSESSYNPKTAKYCYDYDNSNPIAFPITTEQIYNYFNSSTGEFSSPFTEGSYISLGNSGYPSNGFSDTLKEHIMSIYSFGGNTSYNSYFGFDCYNYFKTKHECIKFWTLGGLYIKADKIYKPIIKDGYVSDFTEDLDTESDIDKWIGNTNHEVPDESPVGSGSGDDIDEIGINDFPISDIGGLARYYAIDRFQLDELQGDFKNSTTGIPLDAGQFVIGLYQFPLDIPSFCTTSKEKIVLGKLETNAVGKKLLTVNRRVHLGEYFISANCGDNFLDYSPYTEIKLYIPYCGMVELPPNLFINSTVSVDMIIDIISGSCKGIVMCNNTFYTSISGSLMCSLPLSLEQCATKSLSIINSANSIMSGIIFGNKNYSALNTVTTLGEAMIENNNIAPSHISGNMDSVVNFYEPQCCILFMTYPQVNMGDIGKTHGKVCNYQDTLKNCHGYTVVNNPHLEIKCTNTEKDEITKLLEQGVILP